MHTKCRVVLVHNGPGLPGLLTDEEPRRHGAPLVIVKGIIGPLGPGQVEVVDLPADSPGALKEAAQDAGFLVLGTNGAWGGRSMLV